MACVWARHVGLPIGEIVLATNANQTITDFLRSGEWHAAGQRGDARLGDGRG